MIRLLPAVLATTLLTACATPRALNDADAFMAAVGSLCGQAFAGRLVSDDEADANSAFATQPLVMHVRACSSDEIRIPLHVGDNRSRTWVLTRTETGVRLKHDHRHEDGTSDAVTMYGGDSTGAGAARREFPVDAESQALFVREGLDVSVTNVWAMEIEPGAAFAYELRRAGRHFRAEFDLTNAVPAPPPPWGAEAN